MHSHHSHSGAYCAHAGDCTPSSMLSHAIALGFTSFHLSEHIPRLRHEHLYPEEISASLWPDKLTQRFEAYLVEAPKAANHAMQQNQGFECLVGAETENVGDQRGLEDLVAALEGPRYQPNAELRASLVGAGRVQYLVGGVHHAHGQAIDFDVPTFQAALRTFAVPGRSFSDSEAQLSEEQQTRIAHWRLAAAYLDAQYALMQRVRPEVVAHFDLVRLWSSDLPLLLAAADQASLSGAELEALRTTDARVTRNVRYAASYGALFEVSGAAVRKGWPTPYPGQEILELILQLKGRLCLSDDAHSHAQIGHSFREVRQYLVSNAAPLWRLRADDAPLVRSDAEHEDEETERCKREASLVPGEEAPVRFERGTRAELVDANWAEDSFWEALEKRRAELE